MRKYRLTKITVKTREIVSRSKYAANHIHSSVFPQCDAPLQFSILDAENNAARINFERRPTSLLPAEVTDNQLITE